MFFNANVNAVIGYKRLSNSDLGLGNSHQTHIGLFEETFRFNNSLHNINNATLIYGNSSEKLFSYVDYIQNPDGTYRSPKIRIGTNSSLSIVKRIRDIIQNNINSNWYLIWYGLENDELVFFLIEEDDIDYNYLKQIINFNNIRSKIFNNEINFVNIVTYLNSKMNNLSQEYLEDLETTILFNEQKNNINLNDFNKAQQIFANIGQKGEELIAEYLEKLKSLNKISNFEWMNKSKESYLPYDFKITDNNSKNIFTDVKSTNFRFNQDIFFSKQELEFINKNSNNYLVQRVYNIKDNPLLKESKNMSILSNKFINDYNNFNKNINDYSVKTAQLNIRFNPNNNLIHFGQDIIL